MMVRARPDRGDAASAGCPEYQCPETLDRYVWDSDQILQEIRVATVDAGDAPDAGFYGSFGRIAYTHAGGIDRPISAVRYSGSAAHGVVVRWNWRALVTGATFTDGTYQRGSLNLGTVRWPGANSTALLAKSSPYQSPQWWGSVLMNMQDASGQLYRRNRYYDPGTGRFTQEDPIGLAGGLIWTADFYFVQNASPPSLGRRRIHPGEPRQTEPGSYSGRTERPARAGAGCTCGRRT